MAQKKDYYFLPEKAWNCGTYQLVSVNKEVEVFFDDEDKVYHQIYSHLIWAK